MLKREDEGPNLMIGELQWARTVVVSKLYTCPWFR